MSRKNAACRSWSLAGLVMVGLLLQTSTTQTQQGATYTWTTIDPPGATLATAAALSSNGYIAGRWDGPDGRRRGYLLANGTYFTIEPPGATFTNANGANSRGEMSGQYVDSSGKRHGWLLRDGIFTNVDVPGAAATGGSELNARG
jgi:hypothetical protein